MIIGVTHWLLAVSIAVVIHLAGVLWLSFPTSTRDTLAERSSESIVVTLGREARRAVDDAQALTPDDGSPVGASDAADAPQSKTAGESPEPEVSPATAAQSVMDIDTVDAADTVEAGAAQEASVPEPASAPQTTTPEPESVAPERETTSVEVPEAVAARDASQAEPTIPQAREVPQSPEPGARKPSQVETVVVEASVQNAPATAVQAEAAAATAFADAVTVPAPAVTRASTERELTSGTVPANATGAEAAPVQRARRATPVVEDASVVQSDKAEPAPGIEAVEAMSADEAGIEVATARRPDPAVEPASEPEVREAAAPEVIDLQALQERGGGSGVAARYAGVLKGWLQKNMHYPRAARLAGQEGEVVVRFVIDRNGAVQAIRVESKSGFPLLDREAREMIERGNPFPGIPDDMPGQQLEVRVPVNFHVRDETMTKEIPPIYLE